MNPADSPTFECGYSNTFQPGPLAQRAAALFVDTFLLAFIVRAGVVISPFVVPLILLAVVGYTQHSAGATPGKRFLHLEVQRPGRGRAGPTRAILRYVLFSFWLWLSLFIGYSIGVAVAPHAVSESASDPEAAELALAIIIGVAFVAFGMLAHLLFCLSRADRRALHDLIAGTIVVDTEKRDSAQAPVPERTNNP